MFFHETCGTSGKKKICKKWRDKLILNILFEHGEIIVYVFNYVWYLKERISGPDKKFSLLILG